MAPEGLQKAKGSFVDEDKTKTRATVGRVKHIERPRVKGYLLQAQDR